MVTPLPLDTAPASAATLSVDPSASAGSAEEDALFLDLTSAAGGVLRYPITLVAP